MIDPNTQPPIRLSRLFRSFLFAASVLSVASAQTVPATPSAAPAPAGKENVIELSPFVIDGSNETGWVATQTLGGSRMKTDFKDLAQPMEVLTMDFMRDLGVNSFEQALIYSTNIEGPGEIVDGDGTGFGVFQPRNNTRVRGLTGATLSRNFFEAVMPTDNYNLDRVTIARGPNAILFGLGSPSGIVDVSLQRADLRRRTVATELQFNSEDSRRSSFNFNQPILKDRLGVRVAWMSEENVTSVKPNLDRQDRYYGAVTAQPFKHTTISVHGEKVERFSNRAPRITPVDAVSLWENASRVAGSLFTTDKPLFDNRVTGSSNPGGLTVGGLTNHPVFARQGNPAVWLYGAGALNGDFRGWNNAVVIREPQDIPGTLNPYNPLDRQSFTIGDEHVTPFSTNLFGTSRGMRMLSDSISMFVEQRLARDLHLELAFNKEDYDERVSDSGFAAGTLRADANRYLPDGVTLNPNAGRYYIQGRGIGEESWINRDDWRATLSYEFDFGRQFASNRILKWLGRNRLALLASGSESASRRQQVQRGILEQNVTLTGVTVPTGSYGTPTGTGTQLWATNSIRDFTTRFYLGGPEGNSAYQPFTGLHETWRFNDSAGRPMGAYLFDSPYVNSQGWKLIRTGSGPEGTLSDVRTQMFAWQNYLLKDRLVLLFGYRKDTAKSATIDPIYQVRDWSGLYPSVEVARFGGWGASQSGITRTYGGVFHVTRWASVTYNKSDTFQPNIGRFDPFGNEYPGAVGIADDIGVSLGLFDGKFIVRASRFSNTAGPTRAGNQGFNDPYRDQVYNIDNNMKTLDPAMPQINAGKGGYREKGRANYWVMYDGEAKGYELDVSWLPNRNWSFKANAAKQDSTESNIGTPWFDWMAQRLPVWKALNVPEGGKTNPRDVNGDGVIGTWTWSTAPWDGNNAATKSFERYFNEDVASSVAFMKAVDGRGRSQGRNLRWNFIAGHNVTEGRLRGLSANVAARFRSAPNLGYGLKTLPDGTVTFDLAKALEGKTEFYADAGLAYRGKSKFLGNSSYRVQVNIRNVLNEHDLVPNRVLSTGQYVAWARVEPRLVVFTVGFDL